MKIRTQFTKSKFHIKIKQLLKVMKFKKSEYLKACC